MTTLPVEEASSTMEWSRYHSHRGKYNQKNEFIRTNKVINQPTLEKIQTSSCSLKIQEI